MTDKARPVPTRLRTPSRPGRHHRRLMWPRRRLLWTAAGALCAVVLLAAACSEGDDGPTAPPAPAPAPAPAEHIGPRVYVVAADYNYGQISADWAETYAPTVDAEILATVRRGRDTMGTSQQ